MGQWAGSRRAACLREGLQLGGAASLAAASQLSNQPRVCQRPNTGAKVPADLRLVVCKTATLRAEQSSLTGEPQAVLKGIDAVPDPDCELQVGTGRVGLWLRRCVALGAGGLMGLHTSAACRLLSLSATCRVWHVPRRAAHFRLLADRATGPQPARSPSSCTAPCTATTTFNAVTSTPSHPHRHSRILTHASLITQAKECMLFAGTAVANGSGLGVVTATGMATEIGKIQSQIAAASAEEDDTPLKQKLDEFGELLAKVGVVACRPRDGRGA